MAVNANSVVRSSFMLVRVGYEGESCGIDPGYRFLLVSVVFIKGKKVKASAG